MSKSPRSVFVLSCLLASSAAALALPVPVVEYEFNAPPAGTTTPVSPGTQAASNATPPNLTMLGDDGATPTNRIGGTGPSGQGSDFTFVKAAASTSKGIAKFAGDVAQLDNLSSFTITFWFNGQTISAASDRVVVYGGTDGGQAGAIEVEANPLSAGVGNFNVKVGTSAQNTIGSYAGNVWQFIAVTYDGSLGAAAANNLKFYSGDLTTFNLTPVVQSNTSGTLAAPSVQQLLVGNRTSDLARPLGFNLDDLTIFGAKGGDGSGALSVNDLQTVYNDGKANFSVVPEPCATALLGLAAMGLVNRRRRV